METLKSFVFFGTPAVSRDTLAYLFEQGFIPSLVVSSPDAPRGRGLALTPSETSAYAKEHGIPVITPEKLTPEVVEEIKAKGADYAVVVAYGKFLPESLIEAFPLGAINVHYSLLPKYRGASPVESALLNGETVTGVSIQKMVKEMDAGDVIAAKEVSIGATETTRELRPRLIQVGAELLIDILPRFEKGELQGLPQDHTSATFARKIEKSAGELNLLDDAKENWNKYRAYAESPGTHFFLKRDGKKVRVKIKSATFENGVFAPTRVTPEGKNEMSYADLIR